MKKKNNHTRNANRFWSGCVRNKRLSRGMQAIIGLNLLFTLYSARLNAQSCSLTLTKTPASAICAGAQATISASTSGINLGTGADGSFSLNNTVYTDNIRSAVNGTNNAGSNKVRVWSTSGFSAGNEVLIITMLDANTSNNLVGRYEFKTISSISGDTLLFTQTIANTYVASSTLKHQVIKVPQYNNVVVTNGGVLTCNAWNGVTGGVLCFRASGNVTINNGGQITADAKGYRGISHSAMYRLYNGAQGEGIYGQGYTGGSSNGSNGSWNNANGNGGGGGTGMQDAAGGGGGSYGTAGASASNYSGHNAGVGGNTVGNASLTLLYLGGAGGEGGADEDGAAPGGGGNGGGIILISANAISVNGLITSSGANGGTGTNNGGGSGCGMAGGGGGAGGSIYLSTNSISGNSSNFIVNGGAAGANNGCGGYGANGGYGRIRIDANGTIPSTTPSPFTGSIPSLSGLTYLWSNGSTASSIVVSPTTTTNYSVTITSTTGCTGTSANTTVTVNPAPVLTISGNSAICAGASLTLTAGGANTYTWNTGSNASALSISPSASSSYTLNGTSASGCVGTAIVSNVTVNPNPTLTVNSGAICNGSSFTITPSGASTYTIQGGSNVVNPGASTSYTVKGTSAFGCAGNMVTSSVTVNALPVVSITGNTTLCAGDASTLTASGASAYVWSNGATTNAIVVTPGSNTTYSVTGTSAAGCVANGSSNLTVNALPVVSINGTNTICNGDIAVLTASGASSYAWSNGSTTSSISVTPSASASYSVAGTSAAGCIGNSTSFNVTVNPLPVVSITGTNAICSGNAALLNANGADSYVWSNGATTTFVIVSPTNTSTYSVTGTSSLGCTGTVAFTTVTVNPTPYLTINGTNTLCLGGSVNLTANGAASYVWSDNSTNSTLSVSPISNSNYSVTGFSSAGCQSSTSIALTVYSLPIVSISGTTSICAGSSATLSASGASSYVWNTGATTANLVVTPTAQTNYSVSGTSANGCVGNSSLKTVSVNALPVVNISGTNTICAGNSSTLTASGANTYVWSNGATSASIVVSPSANTSYSVTGTNTLGCVGNSSPVTVTVNALPAVAITGTTALCAGTQVSLNASGANSYLWNTGSTNNVLSVSPSVTTSYTLTGTSAAGCQSTTVRTLTVYALPLVSISGTNAVCAGNSATLIANGANSYNWSNGATSTSIVVSPSVATNFSVSGTSSQGCVGNSTLTNVSINSLPVISISGTSVICAGNTTTLTASGAASYTWSNGATNSSVTLSPSASTVYSVVGSSSAGCVGNSSPLNLTVNALPLISISGNNTLCAGNSSSLAASGANSYSWSNGSTSATLVVTPSMNTTYTVTGTNSNGCQNNALKTITVNALPVVAINGNSAICIGSSATLSANGASTYTWSNASTSNSISVTPTISTGFSVIGASTAGCLGSAVTNLTVNPLPVVSVTGNTAICVGASNTLNASGASSYVWSNGSTSNSIVVSPSVSTSYWVTGTSTDGCIGNSSVFTLTVNALPQVSINGNSVVCAGNSVSLLASGANSYSWSTGATSNSVSDTPTLNTTYTVTGTDTNGCQNVAITSVTVNALPVISISGINTLCAGDSTQLSASGANSYSWNNGANTASILVTPQSSTMLVVNGTDTNGCNASDSTAITVNALPVLSISGLNTLCLGDSTLLSANGAGTYTWSNGSTASSIMVAPISTTNYSVSGTSTAGCAGLPASTTVTVNALPVVSVSGNTSTCAGNSNSLTASGALSYTWSNGDTTAITVVNPSQNISYTVSGSNSFGCKASASIAITVNALPVLTVQATALQLCTGQSANITAQGANSYNWSDGQNGAGITVTPTISTQYIVSGSDSLGCSSTASISLQVSDCTASLQQRASAKGVRVYPNPNTGNFVIELNDNSASSISIVNALGQTVLTQTAENINHINLSGLNNGLYFVRVIENNRFVYTTAVIKQ